MAKRSDDRDIETMTEDWISINEKEDVQAFEAWASWRSQQMGCHNFGHNMTVPTPFPPTSVSAAREYIAVVQQIRKAIGWNGTKAKLKTDISAWMGGGDSWVRQSPK